MEPARGLKLHGHSGRCMSGTIKTQGKEEKNPSACLGSECRAWVLVLVSPAPRFSTAFWGKDNDDASDFLRLYLSFTN